MEPTVIDSLAGGSLCEVLAVGDTVVKRYRGPIARGKEKLIREHEWLCAVPTDVARCYPTLFPRPVKLISNAERGQTELHLTKLNRPTLSKAILSAQLTNVDVAAALQSAFDLLINVVYPMRRGSIESAKGYRSFHADRIALARKYLRRLPYMQPILDANEIIVNEVPCPSLNQFLTWLDAKNTEIFISRQLCAFHGNFHLDNILYDQSSSDPLSQRLSFIDPRGEMLGFPHYDFSKVLITLEAYYDEIHYGKCAVLGKLRGSAYELQITIASDYDEVYVTGLKVLGQQLQTFAHIEGVNPEQFVRMVLLSECIHILSFCFYHAYNPGTVPNRIRAYVAIWALLCRRLLDGIDSGIMSFSDCRILLR